jgi:putative PIN family toxin of toxin-antitoxin system
MTENYTKVIIDTNIIFSSLLASSSKLRDTLMKSDIIFYAPNYLFVEIFKYKEKILKYSKIDESEIYIILDTIISNINFINMNFISVKNRQKAYDLCKDIDEKDLAFVALALELNALLWTGDQKLRKGLESKNFGYFYNI